MQRIATTNRVPDLFGLGKNGFRNGDLANGLTPTNFSAEWCNSVQEEIANVVEVAGIPLDVTQRFQLLQALRSSGVFETPSQFDNGSRAATMAAVQTAGLHFQPQAGLGISANFTMPLTASGHWAEVQANVTVSLLPLAQCPAGLVTFTLKAKTAFTLKAAGAEQIQVNAISTNSYQVGIGQTLTIVSNGPGANWYVVSEGFGSNSPALTGAPTAPTPGQYDASIRLATMAALQAAGLHFQNANGMAIPGSVSMTLAASGHWAEIQNPGLTVTLPPLSTTAAGLTTYTFKSNYAATIKGSGTELISAGLSGGNTYATTAGETTTLVSNGPGAVWYVVANGLSLAALTALFAPSASPVFTGAPTAPTPAQFDSSAKLATMAAVQASGLHYHAAAGLGLSTNLTLLLSDSGHWAEIQAAGLTITLPTLASTAGGLVTYTFKANFATTIKGNGAELINGGLATANTYVMAAGETAMLVSNGAGTSWYVVSAGLGSAALAGMLQARGVAFGGQVIVSVPTALTSGHAGREVTVTAGVAVTLPSAASCGSGSVIQLISTTNGASVARSGADIISPMSYTSMPLNFGDTLTLMSDGGAQWIAIGGSASLGYSGVFSSSQAANGYQKLPGGLILQWATGTGVTAEGTQVVSFPIAFPSACLFVNVGTMANNALADGWFDYVSSTTTGATVMAAAPNAALGATCTPTVFAIGK